MTSSTTNSAFMAEHRKYTEGYPTVGGTVVEGPSSSRVTARV